MASASAKYAMIFLLFAGNKHDAPEGRSLIKRFYSEDNCYLLMKRACEDNNMRELVVKQGFAPVVTSKRNRKEPWDYDKELYKRRNEVERYFLCIKRFRHIFTRCCKLDTLYLCNLTLAMIFMSFKCEQALAIIIWIVALFSIMINKRFSISHRIYAHSFLTVGIFICNKRFVDSKVYSIVKRMNSTNTHFVRYFTMLFGSANIGELF